MNVTHFPWPLDETCSKYTVTFGSNIPVRIISVTNTDPDPYDPYVFGPPGSGPVITRYGSESLSRSFYQQAKIGRKTLIPTFDDIFEKLCKCSFKK